MEIRKVEYKDEEYHEERKELENIRCSFKRITWQKISKTRGDRRGKWNNVD